ncbi:hypothetical protein AGMMS49991_07830 [Spirochaetia bacterium]|nr:hypothetical protein AGMMS49991_07830 [Spirochaetia bacterium]
MLRYAGVEGGYVVVAEWSNTGDEFEFGVRKDCVGEGWGNGIRHEINEFGFDAALAFLNALFCCDEANVMTSGAVHGK